MNRELRLGLIDALYYANRSLIRIVNSEQYLNLNPVDPVRSIVGTLSRVINVLMEYLIRYEEGQQ